jgi:hypothetical protein
LTELHVYPLERIENQNLVSHFFLLFFIALFSEIKALKSLAGNRGTAIWDDV